MSQFDLKRDGKMLTVVSGGDFTAVLIPDLKPAVQKAIEEGITEVVFDLGKTTILDSTGIGFTIAVYNSLTKKGGTMRVVNVSDDILRLLQSMRLDQRLGVKAANQEK